MAKEAQVTQDRPLIPSCNGLIGSVWAPYGNINLDGFNPGYAIQLGLSVYQVERV